MAKVKEIIIAKPVPVTVVEKVILELTGEEAAVLRVITRWIAGNPGGYRGVTDAIGRALNHPDIEAAGKRIGDKRATGTICFLPEK